MSEIAVETVSQNRVEIRAGNVFFIFSLNNADKLVFSKKKESRAYDPAALWVSDYLFKKVCRQAAAILKNQKRG